MNNDETKPKKDNGTGHHADAPAQGALSGTNAHDAAGRADSSSNQGNAPPNKILEYLRTRPPPFWQASFSGLLVLNALIQIYFLSGQLGNATKATTILRQQLVGTQAAVVTLGLSLYPNNTLFVSFDPRGVVAAKNVCLAFSAVRKTIPSLAEIETPISHNTCDAVLSEKVPGGGIHEYGLPGLTPAVMEAIRRTEQTVMVTGDFSYDDGFGDIQRKKVCLYWLVGIPNKTEAEGGANGFYQCEGFYVQMRNVLKAKAEAKEP